MKESTLSFLNRVLCKIGSVIDRNCKNTNEVLEKFNFIIANHSDMPSFSNVITRNKSNKILIDINAIIDIIKESNNNEIIFYIMDIVLFLNGLISKEQICENPKFQIKSKNELDLKYENNIVSKMNYNSNIKKEDKNQSYTKEIDYEISKQIKPENIKKSLNISNLKLHSTNINNNLFVMIEENKLKNIILPYIKENRFSANEKEMVDALSFTEIYNTQLRFKYNDEYILTSLDRKSVV